MSKHIDSFIAACEIGDLNRTMQIQRLLYRSDHLARHNAAFMKACKNGHADIVEYLLTLRPEIPVFCREHAAFKLACRGNHVHVVEILSSKYEPNSRVMLEIALAYNMNTDVILHLIYKYGLLGEDEFYDDHCRSRYNRIIAKINLPQPKSAAKV